MFGIDVSSVDLNAALCYSLEGKPVLRRQVPNTADGVDQLLRLAPPEAPWVVEPTGRYSHLVVQRAQAAGRTVLLAPPRETKMYLSSLHPRAKTDKLDGLGLALYGLTHPLHTYTLKSEAVDQLDQLLCARKGLSRALSSLRLQADDLPRAKETLRPSIDHLAQQIRLLDKQIAAITGDTAHPEFAAAKRLQQITGVGPVTAAAVASRLSAKQFSHPDEFVAYAGLDIRVAQSGKRNGQLGLTKRGDAEIRRLLFVCAKATLTAKDNPFKAQYERERAKGMSATAALCAVARKLACVCWSLHRHGTDYDPERVATRPEPKKRTDSST